MTGPGPGPDYPDSYLARRSLPDGRSLAVFSLTYGRARLVIGRGSIVYDRAY